MKSVIYDIDKEEKGELELDERIFDLPWNGDLVHQVVVSIQSNLRAGTAHAKDRSEVRGGGKKPWRQKGLGRARHGSIRSPIWVGGGVTHGPRKEKNYSKKINKKMMRKAFFTVLSKKLKDKEIIFLEGIIATEPKTKSAKLIVDKTRSISGFEKLAAKGGRAIVAVHEKNKDVFLSFRNLPYIETKEARNLNPLDLLNVKYLVLTKKAAEDLKSKIK